MDDKKMVFPLTGGWPGYAASAVIVAVRALRPGAVPMEDWSWWSWPLMFLPALFPAAVWAASGALWLLAKGIFSAAETAFRRKP